jgi:hypothetical protein
MNIPHRAVAFALLVGCILNQFAFAADTAPAISPDQAIQAAAKTGKLIYLVFYKEADAATKEMAEAVSATVDSQEGQSIFSYVRLNDPAERAIAEKYQVTRAPMPMVIAVHPNGAVTGYFHTKATPEQLSECLVSAKKAVCMKALQQNQLVLVCLQTQAKQPIPQGVQQLKADPHFAQRTQVVTLSINDPAEAAFLASMEFNTKKDGPMTVFLAPPGALVGKFAPTATKDQLAAKLAEAGKCSDDKNCKHNHAQTTQQPRKVTR